MLALGNLCFPLRYVPDAIWRRRDMVSSIPYTIGKHLRDTTRRRWRGRTPVAPRLQAVIEPHVPHSILRHISQHVVAIAKLARQFVPLGLGLGSQLFGELQSEV